MQCTEYLCFSNSVWFEQMHLNKTNDSCVIADNDALVAFKMQLYPNNNNSMHDICARECIKTLTGKQRAERGTGSFQSVSVSQIMVCFCRVVADNVIVWVCFMFACQCLDGSCIHRRARQSNWQASGALLIQPSHSERVSMVTHLIHWSLLGQVCNHGNALAAMRLGKTLVPWRELHSIIRSGYWDS